MKTKCLFMICSLLLLLAACQSNDASETKFKKVTIPDDVPEYVQESDFKKIDWDKKATMLVNGIIGNEGKSGVIGADTPSLDGQKWMWHLWGVDDPSKSTMTVVGYHKETETVHQILTDGWTTSLGAKQNGADAHIPSSVKIPKPGEWAILLYVDNKLFDLLVYDINE
ncbi:hypothetical protein CHH83_24375 [Bacillus sp. 7586-K]|nr:hypothetical protein CHH83_24375 [Bacillus sp. 7586-K]